MVADPAFLNPVVSSQANLTFQLSCFLAGKADGNFGKSVLGAVFTMKKKQTKSDKKKRKPTGKEKSVFVD